MGLTPFLTIFQLYRGSRFYYWRKPEYPEKTTNVVSSILRKFAMSGIRTHNIIISGDRHWLHSYL